MITLVSFTLGVLLAIAQSATLVGTARMAGTSELNYDPNGPSTRLTTDCTTVAAADWDSQEFQYPPMDFQGSEVQIDDGCATWAMPSTHLTTGGSLP